MEPLSYYTNSGAPWFDTEVETLRKEYVDDKLDLLQISKLHKRTPGGIASRLVILKVVATNEDIHGYADYKASSLYKDALNKHKIATTVFFNDVKPKEKPKGYIYCMSNTSMPGIMKVGMTMRSPDERLKEANKHDTFKPPTPYRIDFAKCVTNPVLKELILHDLLARYTERIHPQREFFKVSSVEVKRFFDLIDGTWWSG
jgi:hypothetical protein